jgi:methyl-accepting chemotaxis protein
VVAAEVRALAHRTQQSTREIEAMIGTIQHDSTDAVKAMQQSSQTAEHPLSVAREAHGALRAIASAMGGIDEHTALIATAAEERTLVAKDIDLISIKDLSDQTAAGASQTSSAASEVSHLAAGLRQVVAKFVI